MLNIRMARSSFDDSRMPATMPRSIDSGTMQAKARAARNAVLASRVQMMSTTGTLKRVELPRSPEAILPRNST